MRLDVLSDLHFVRKSSEIRQVSNPVSSLHQI